MDKEKTLPPSQTEKELLWLSDYPLTEAGWMMPPMARRRMNENGVLATVTTARVREGSAGTESDCQLNLSVVVAYSVSGGHIQVSDDRVEYCTAAAAARKTPTIHSPHTALRHTVGADDDPSDFFPRRGPSTAMLVTTFVKHCNWSVRCCPPESETPLLVGELALPCVNEALRPGVTNIQAAGGFA